MPEVEITAVDQHGFGIAPGIVPAPRTLPGEIVDIDPETGNTRILRPSADRIAPPCRHFKTCGGCMMQHASDAFVANWKTGIVRQGLAARGMETGFRPILTSPPQSRRRATLHGRRTKSGALVGLNARASETVIAIPGCQVLHPALVETLPVLERLVALGASRKAGIDLALTLTDTGIDLAVSGAKPLSPGEAAEAIRLAGACFARITWNGDLLAQRQSPAMRIGAALVPLPPAAFLQATAAGEAALLSAVRDIVGGATRIADLFAGIGTFALPLAESADVHAVEGDAAMTAALDRGWRGAPGLHRVTTETRDLFRRPLLPDELDRFDALVIDPPRAGAEAQMREIAASRVPVVAALSCNPVTFARDSRILTDGGYRLDHVQVVDQFRWSPHVELAARFARA
jgi:23S rRNA (uracil1939-C5)-methyltransferase